MLLGEIPLAGKHGILLNDGGVFFLDGVVGSVSAAL